MVEITEAQWKGVETSLANIQQNITGLKPPAPSITKKDVEICIGAECKKLHTKIEDIGTKAGQLSEHVDHLSELVHKGAEGRKGIMTAEERIALHRERVAAAKTDQHTHPNVKGMIDCPECYPGIREAIIPKLTAEGVHMEALKLSEDMRKNLRKKGIPICTDCGIPWEDKETEKCINCGGAQ